jgi:hypothetical protein
VVVEHRRTIEASLTSIAQGKDFNMGTNFRLLIHTNLRPLVVLAVLAQWTVGCTTAPPPKAEKTSAESCQSSGCWVRLTPLARIATDFEDPNENYSNLYTRVLISAYHTRSTAAGGQADKATAPNEASVEDYNYDERNWLAREVWGTHYTMNLTAYLTVGSFQATVPLVTIDHTSDRTNGEKFVRVVAHTSQNFPLFLLRGDGSNAIATLRVVVKASDQIQSDVGTAAIQAAESVAKVLSPEASVVTTLNSQNVKDKATALDKAINSVLSKQLDEEQLIDNDVRRWAAGAFITFSVPSPRNETKWSDSSNFQPVGIWKVQFETPRPSVFSDVQICLPKTMDQSGRNTASWCRTSVKEAAEAAQRDAHTRPEQVLAFNLVNGTQSLGTVSVYLKQQSWWDTSMKTFNGLRGNEKPKPNDVSDFCRSIKNAIAQVGLNAIDAGIVVGSVRDRGQLGATVIEEMKSADDCKDAQVP